MVQQLTQGIKVSIEASFNGNFYKDYKMHYAFSYTVTIENKSKDTVQLLSRHWEIIDSLNSTIIVDGEGVIGKKPIIMPGNQHIYSSNCLLLSPFGAMKGHYNMMNFTSTRKFKVAIPSFKLSQPSAMN